jgi:tRNA(His) 5'-end guanylyltransferase
VQAAEQCLAGTSSGDKNEMLFSKFGINYNDVSAAAAAADC